MTAPEDLEYLELFAGVANVFSEARKANRNALACDVEYGQHFGFAPDSNPFDFMSPSGFAFWAKFVQVKPKPQTWHLDGTIQLCLFFRSTSHSGFAFGQS